MSYQRHPFLGSVLLLCKGYSLCILSPANITESMSLLWRTFVYWNKISSKHTTVWNTRRRHVMKWIKMGNVNGHWNINFLFVFFLRYLTCSMCVYYFLCSKKFCVEKSIWICQALNFMEQKLSGPFWTISGFTTCPFLLICFLSEKKGKLYLTNFWLS